MTNYKLLRQKAILTDSRSLNVPENAVFIALHGERHDGHDFIAELYDKGMRYFVVDDAQKIKILTAQLPESHWIEVPNTRTFLQELAAHHRQQFQYPVIGITGSNGKTIVKEWLFQLLQDDFRIVKSPKSYNSQIGTPLSVWQMNEQHQLAIFEAGISQSGEMDNLAAIIRPTIGIFTNIGSAHDEGFANRTEKTKEKIKLFKNAKTLIYCADDALIDAQANTLTSVERFSFGKNENNNIQIIQLIHHKKNSDLHIIVDKKPYVLTIPFTDQASIENCLHCIAALLVLGYEIAEIQAKINAFLFNFNIPMRLEIKRGLNECLLIDDTYNNDLAGLSVALDFLSHHSQNRGVAQAKKTLILSDLLQSGLPAQELYQQIANLIDKHHIGKLIGIGKEISTFAHLFLLDEKHFFADTDSFLRAKLPFDRESILIKGARRFAFERIVAQWQEKIHGTMLEIDFDALIHNLNFYRRLLKPNTKIMVMVKAFAYGNGSFEVANMLQHQKVDYLAVAYADEAVSLRQNGITLPIMVMNPSPETFDKMIALNLEPEIYSPRIFRLFLEYIATQQKNTPFSIHLKLDTGMNRLGFSDEQMPELLQLLSENKSLLRVASVFTHLSGADEERFNEFSGQQFEKFNKNVAAIKKICPEPFLEHACNSAGIVRFHGQSHLHNEMVRLGIGLYGVEANGLLQNQLQTVATLKTVISQIKHLKKGESTGYSRSGRAQNDTTIATIAIGYADGYDRRFGNGVGKVLIHGQLASTIGNICMDMCMINLANIDAQEGDEVIVFGAKPSVIDLAKTVGTIPYEIMTNVGERVKRVFFVK